jgi:hypothetical protein
VKNNITGALMGLTTRFAAELEQLKEQEQGKSREAVSGKVLAHLATQLMKGAKATGISESRLIEECLKACLTEVIAQHMAERRIAEEDYLAASHEPEPAPQKPQIPNLIQESSPPASRGTTSDQVGKSSRKREHQKN